MAEAVEGGLDGMELSPTLSAFAVEFVEECQRTRLQQRAAVVSGFADVALGSTASHGSQSARRVPGVEVAVDEDVRLDAAQFADGRYGGA